MSSLEPNELNKEHIVCKNSPNDSVSRVQFLNSSDDLKSRLLASSWDGSVRLYDCLTGNLLSQNNHENPILDATSLNPVDNNPYFLNDVNAYYIFGNLSGEIIKANFEQNSVNSLVGKHEGPVKCVQFEAPGSIVSGSWDKSVKFWDTRVDTDNSTHKIELKGKVFALAVSTVSQKVVICDSLKTVSVFDRRNLQHPLFTRDGSNPILKTQIRAATCFPDGLGFTLASVEGRVAWEYFDSASINSTDKKNYAFKCHREKNSSNNTELVYPVNAIAFHNKFLGFATGGGDGVAIIWDGFSKKRLWRSPSVYDGAITSLSFHPSEPTMAIGVSQGLGSNIKPHIPGYIALRKFNETDVTPKKTI